MRSFEDARRVYSVTQVNRYVKSLLTNDALLSGIWLRGELSNYKQKRSCPDFRVGSGSPHRQRGRPCRI